MILNMLQMINPYKQPHIKFSFKFLAQHPRVRSIKGILQTTSARKAILYHMLQPVQANAFWRLGTKKMTAGILGKLGSACGVTAFDGWLGGQVLILYVYR